MDHYISRRVFIIIRLILVMGTYFLFSALGINGFAPAFIAYMLLDSLSDFSGDDDDDELAEISVRMKKVEEENAEMKGLLETLIKKDANKDE